MRLAIVATPPLALVSIATLGLGLGLAPRPHREPPAPPPPRFDPAHMTHCNAVVNPLLMMPDASPPTCEHAHRLSIQGLVTGGASRLRLAGPFLSTDVTTDALGQFALYIPVEGNVCDLLRAPQSYSFSDGSMHVEYSVTFRR